MALRARHAAGRAADPERRLPRRLPLDRLHAARCCSHGWLGALAPFNPVTYVLEMARQATVEGIEPSWAHTWPGLLALTGMTIVFGGFALRELRPHRALRAWRRFSGLARPRNRRLRGRGTPNRRRSTALRPVGPAPHLGARRPPFSHGTRQPHTAVCRFRAGSVTTRPRHSTAVRVGHGGATATRWPRKPTAARGGAQPSAGAGIASERLRDELALSSCPCRSRATR